MGKTKDSGGIPATWEATEVMIYCEICAEQVELGNRPTTHFNKEGWNNILSNFRARTGKQYDRGQMKNKWDMLKKEWRLWKDLKGKATGLGWNHVLYVYSSQGYSHWYCIMDNEHEQFLDDDTIEYLTDQPEDNKNKSINMQAYGYYLMLLNTTICLAHQYNTLYQSRVPCMTSTNTGDKWLRELLHGHPSRFYNMFRMSKEVFVDLLNVLVREYELRGSSRTAPHEVLAVTLYVMAQNQSVRQASERFQHSTETISRFVGRGLDALMNMSMKIINPTDREFIDVPSRILHDYRYMPYFKDCIGAIDGTHVDARITSEKKVRYIGRHGVTTQNVMAVCDFNMCFTFVMAGWEGSAHDSRIFKKATRDPSWNFPHAPTGKYYLVDAGYPLERGILKPYPETRYHLSDFSRSNRPISGRQERFNQAHSSLRSVIERTFGVWKKKWAILRDMPQYSFCRQRDIVVATMTVHNFIRRHSSNEDPDFLACDLDENLVYSEANEVRAGQTGTTDVRHSSSVGVGTSEMSALRDAIADQLHNANR